MDAPLEKLRLDILGCNVCFEGSETTKGCWHHEDILGGYEPGRIVVLTINAQRPFDSEWEHEKYGPPTRGKRHAPGRALLTYRDIRDADVATKIRFADRSLEIFAGAPPGEFASWLAHHPGHRDWLPMACELLLGGATPRDRRLLADHFAFVDIYKHATANERHLDLLADDHVGIARCPERWLRGQVSFLRPALVLLCGRSVVSRANALWGVGGEELRRPRSMTSVHGKRWPLDLEGFPVDAWTTFGIADRPAQFRWPIDQNARATADVREAIQDAIRRRGST